MKKTILHSFVGALVFSFTCFLILYGVKARISTNPNITDNTPSALYVNNNETLSAAKRNTLVKSTRREDVATSDTANFNSGCDRKAVMDAIPGQTLYFTQIGSAAIYHKGNDHYRWAIQKTTKGTIEVWNQTTFSSPTTVRVLQKRCQ